MSSTIWTKAFLISLLERVLATFVVTFLAVSGLDAGAGADSLSDINWQAALIAAGTAAVLSAVKGAIANLVTKDGPSLTHAETVTPPAT